MHLEKWVDIGELNINRIMYPDDSVIIASTVEQLSALMNELVSKGKLHDIEVNMSKTKMMVVSRMEMSMRISVLMDRELKVSQAICILEWLLTMMEEKEMK